jgi:hypothetical protein
MEIRYYMLLMLRMHNALGMMQKVLSVLYADD